MDTQDPLREARGSQADSGDRTRRMAEAAGAAFSQASDMARDASAKAKGTASSTASSKRGQVKELLDHQIDNSADMAGSLASSARVAADDLEKNSPVLAGFVRSFAGKMEGYADNLHEQTVDQLAHSAAEFTRRQPALVFGLAALAGFLMFRTAKSTPTVRSPRLQPEDEPLATG